MRIAGPDLGSLSIPRFGDPGAVDWLSKNAGVGVGGKQIW